MTHREEFERARAAGLRQRQALRMARALQRQADIPCAGCGATARACETKRWLGARTCCDDCQHTPRRPDDATP